MPFQKSLRGPEFGKNVVVVHRADRPLFAVRDIGRCSNSFNPAQVMPVFFGYVELEALKPRDYKARKFDYCLSIIDRSAAESLGTKCVL